MALAPLQVAQESSHTSQVSEIKMVTSGGHVSAQESLILFSSGVAYMVVHDRHAPAVSQVAQSLSQSLHADPSLYRPSPQSPSR